MPIVLVGVGISFFALVAAFMLAGLSQTHAAQHGTDSVGGFLSNALKYSAVGQLLGLATKASRYAISHFAGAQLKHLTAFFTSLAFLFGYTYKAIANLAKVTADAVQSVEGRVKTEVHRAIRAEHTLQRTLTRDVHAAERETAKVAHSLAKYEARTATELHHLTHAVDVAIPRALGKVRSEEEALSRDITKLRERTSVLEKGAEKTFEWIRTHPLSAVTGVFAGAVAVALSRLGFGFFRCKSWQKLGRSITCNDANILADLLAAATLIVGVMSLEELAKAEQAVIGEAATVVRKYWEV